MGTIISHPKRKYIKGDSDYYIGVKVGKRTYNINPYCWEITDADEEIVGTITQFPLTLCYAMTVHKTQGLGFDYILIQPGDWGFFANGQLYTSLSRSSNPDGLRLLRPITLKDVKVDQKALEWNNKVIENNT